MANDRYNRRSAAHGVSYCNGDYGSVLSAIEVEMAHLSAFASSAPHREQSGGQSLSEDCRYTFFSIKRGRGISCILFFATR